MSVDVTALKTLAEEKKLPLERLINAIENEVAKAYAELPVAKAHGRAVLNRQTGEILIYVPLLGPDGDRIDTVTDESHGPVAHQRMHAPRVTAARRQDDVAGVRVGIRSDAGSLRRTDAETRPEVVGHRGIRRPVVLIQRAFRIVHGSAEIGPCDLQQLADEGRV